MSFPATSFADVLGAQSEYDLPYMAHMIRLENLAKTKIPKEDLASGVSTLRPGCILKISFNPRGLFEKMEYVATGIDDKIDGDLKNHVSKDRGNIFGGIGLVNTNSGTTQHRISFWASSENPSETEMLRRIFADQLAPAIGGGVSEFTLNQVVTFSTSAPAQQDVVPMVC